MLIIIIDVNDYFLIFVLDMYSIFINEDEFVGFFLLSLVINDFDKGIEVRLWFMVEFGDLIDSFDVRFDLNNFSIGILYIIVFLD